MRATAPAVRKPSRGDDDEPPKPPDITAIRERVITRIHDTMLKPSHSRHGQASWDIHREFMPTLIAEVPALHKRREEDWLNAGSTRLPALGVRGRWDTTIAPAMKELYDELVNQLRDEGLTRAAAKKKVEEESVKPSQGLGGVDTWRIHIDAVPLLVNMMERLYPKQRGGGRET